MKGDGFLVAPRVCSKPISRLLHDRLVVIQLLKQCRVRGSYDEGSVQLWFGYPIHTFLYRMS